MATTDNLSAQKYAANAAVSAAEAKSYAQTAIQAEDYSKQAQASAESATASAASASISAGNASASEISALSSAESAALSAQNATITANLYPSLDGDLGANAAIAAGIIPNGAIFFVRSTSDSSIADEYQNVAGVATATGKAYPSMGAIVAFGKENAPPLSLQDSEGFVILSLNSDGELITPNYELNKNMIEHDKFSIVADETMAFSVVDGEGYVAFGVDHNGNLVGDFGGGSGGGDSNGLNTRDAYNIAKARLLAESINSEVQRPTAKYNHYILYGQSLASAMEGWPALSKVPVSAFGNLMLGSSVRPSSRTNPAFVPLGSATLQPLKAVVQDITGATVLTDSQVAALTPGVTNEGESPDVGAMNMMRKLFLQYHGVETDSGRLFVTTNCAVGGQTIEALSKGATPELYLRTVQAAQQVKSIADSESASYRIPAIIWMQGEYNYVDTYGGVTTKDGYKAKLLQLRNDLNADIVSGIAGQSNPCAFVTYQTGGSFTRDDNELSIGMAQWELSEEQPNWYLATPVYQYTDKGGHLDSNGYRWVGQQIGKVLHKVITLGQEWKPLSPTKITVDSNVVYIDFHVPYPPLVFDSAYVINTATMYADKGFTVIDSGGVVAISNVEIAADTIIKITLSRATTGSVRVRYADKTYHNGNGNLRDSDPFVASENYEYATGTGQYPSANIAALVNKPYPLQNWCIAFSLLA